MRVFVLANNWTGWQAVRYLVAHGDEVVGLALHPAERRKCGAEMVLEVGAGTPTVDGSRINAPATIARIAALRPDVCLSVFFGYILKAPFLAAFPHTLNLHPSYLPYGRGANPNVWAIVEGTPAGATLHYVDAGVDTGDIVHQERVAVEPWDSGATLYHKLEACCLAVLAAAWPGVRDGTAPRVAQPTGGSAQPPCGTVHRAAELATLDCLDLDAPTTARAVLDRLRARTFPPYSGCYFTDGDGRRVDVRVTLEAAK